MPIIDVTKEVTSRLSIEPNKDLFDGLCPMKLVDVFITEQTDEKGQFDGLKKKVINFEFQNYKLNTSDPDRYYVHQEKVVGNKKKEGEEYVNMETKDYDNLVVAMWGRVKHILDSMKGLPNYKDITLDKKLVAHVDFPNVDDGKILNDYFNKFAEYIVTFVKGPKPEEAMFLNAKGEGFAVWGKLLPDRQKGTRFVFPGFVGKGFLERMVFNSEWKPTLPKIIKIYPNETIEMSVKKAPESPKMPTMTPGSAPQGLANALGIS
jgi:hypothetical protein